MIQIVGLKKNYSTGIFRRHTVKALDGVDLVVPEEVVLGIAGQSGCGKTTLALCLLALVAPTSGQIRINGIDLTALSASRLRNLRPRYQMIWQNPQTSLNPRMRLKDAILEPVRYYRLCTRVQESAVLEEHCRQVELPEAVLNRYPHEVSGGENQRAVIARILTLSPQVLIADEPTSALDMLVQVQILQMLKAIQRERRMTMVFISHDLHAIRFICDKVAVMQQGRIVEQGSCGRILSCPEHPHSRQLVENAFGQWRPQ